MVIDTDRVHSTLRAQAAVGQTPLVLPYVAFRGKWQIPIEVFKDMIEPFLQEDVAELRRDGCTFTKS